MSSRVEIEAKYFLGEAEKLKRKIKEMSFREESFEKEVDEYFTDLDSKFIENRTCLRIRKNFNFNTNLLEKMELTFKGKSIVNKETYAKKENNITINSEDYEELLGMLNDLGYYTYVIVDKERRVYSKEKDGLTYNVMIDKIKDVGSFVEFEILCDDDNKSIDVLKEKLNNFVKKFLNEIKMKVAELPYRDFVANFYFNNVTDNGKRDVLLLDMDGTLIDSEKEFYKAFRDVLLNKFNYELSINEYKENEIQKDARLIEYLKEKNIIPISYEYNEIMNDVYEKYDIYFVNILNNKDSLINLELLGKLKEKGYKIAIVSTSKMKFISRIIKKLNLEKIVDTVVSREDVKKLKPDSEAYELALKKLNVKKENCIAIEDSEKGIQSAKNAGIFSIKVNQFDIDLKEEKKKRFSEIGLILINEKG